MFVCLNLSFVSLLRSPACPLVCLFACLAQRQIVVFSSLIYFAELVAVPVDSDGNATCVCAACSSPLHGRPPVLARVRASAFASKANGARTKKCHGLSNMLRIEGAADAVEGAHIGSCSWRRYGPDICSDTFESIPHAFW